MRDVPLISAAVAPPHSTNDNDRAIHKRMVHLSDIDTAERVLSPLTGACSVMRRWERRPGPVHSGVRVVTMTPEGRNTLAYGIVIRCRGRCPGICGQRALSH